MSNRDGNAEIYVMNRDGTDSAGSRTTRGSTRRRRGPRPAPRSRSPRIAAARPQIYIVNVDGTGLQRISTEALVRSRDLVAGAVQRDRLCLAQPAAATTSGSSTSPPGRHGRSPTASAATRARRSRRTAVTSRSCRIASGRPQIYTIARDGTDLRQITKAGTTSSRTGRSRRGRAQETTQECTIWQTNRSSMDIRRW